MVNNGIVPQYHVENSHDAIIPRELFQQVQEEMAHRERGYSFKYALSGIVFCGECGEIYRRVHWNNRGCRSIVWRCVSRLEEKGKECTSATMNEEVLHQGVVKAINQVLRDKDAFIATLRENIKAVIGGESDIGDIDARLKALQTELLQLANSGESYDSVLGEINRLRELKGRVADIENKRRRVSEAIEYVDKQDGTILEFDDVLVRKLVERITVYEEHMVVEFKSGMEVEVGWDVLP